MRALLLAALWIHLASSVLLMGAFFMLLLAGPSSTPTARRWDRTVVAWSRLLVLVDHLIQATEEVQPVGHHLRRADDRRERRLLQQLSEIVLFALGQVNHLRQEFA